MKKMFLICNAHLDPIWQWEWPEGAAAAVSTFRVAASLCEEYGCFVFNHQSLCSPLWCDQTSERVLHSFISGGFPSKCLDC